MSRQDTDSGSRLLKPRFVACALLLLLLVILGITVLVINRQYNDLKKQALASDSTVTGLLSEFVLCHEKAAIALLQSYAGRPSFIDAVKRKDVAKTRNHLEDMKKVNEELDLTFITDKKGILWVNYPVFPESVGKDLSYRDWYKGVSSGWKPYISSVFKLIVADQPLAVAVCTPIFDGEGNVIGILASSQRVSFLAETIRHVPLQSYTKVTLLDRAGNTIYSNRLPYTAEITTYPFLSAVKEALQAGKSRIEIKESQRGGSTVSATVRPIAPIEWTVVAEHTNEDVLRAGYSQFVTTAAMSLLFFTAISLLLLYARKQALLADTERLLMMERKISEEERQRQMQDKLSHSQMRYLRLHESMIDGFVVTGMDGYIRECNQAYQHMLGYGPDDIMSLTYNDITPAKWHDFEKTIVEEQVIPRGHSEVYEKEYIRKDGTVFPVELRAYLVKDDKGSPSEMWAVVRDITQRKKAEDALKLSEEAARRLAQEAGCIAEIGRIISSSLDIEEVYELFADEVRKLIPFDRILVNLVNQQEGVMTTTYTAGMDVAGRRKGVVFPFAGSITEEMIRTGAPILFQPESIEEVQNRFPGLVLGFQAGLRSRLSVLLIAGGRPIGSLVLWSKQEKAYGERDIWLAQGVAGQIAGAIANAQLFRERKQADEKIRASLREKEVLLKEIHHRVKNNLQIVSSLLFLQSSRTEHPEAVSVLRESRNRIRSMALIHERLYQSPNLAVVDMGKYTRKLVSDLRRSLRPEDSPVRLTVTVDDIPLGITEAIPCGLIINELVSNALKHAFPTGKAGELTIQLQRGNTNQVTLTVSDNGIGFPESVDFRKSPSLGLTLINSLVEQLHGAIELDKRGGTIFTITFG